MLGSFYGNMSHLNPRFLLAHRRPHVKLAYFDVVENAKEVQPGHPKRPVRGLLPQPPATLRPHWPAPGAVIGIGKRAVPLVIVPREVLRWDRFC